MSVYCWGENVHGQLGLGTTEEQKVTTPCHCKHLSGKPIRQICPGGGHTLFVTDEGVVFSCGSNDRGQLGHDKNGANPELINVLETKMIRQASCGLAHSLVVNDHAQVFAWGCNDCGQLGVGDFQDRKVPKLLRTITTPVVQVSCGSNHCLALTQDGQIYAWGSNANGQLGLGISTSQSQHTPQVLQCLRGLPVAQVSAGGAHSTVLTLSGALFTWGKNRQEKTTETNRLTIYFTVGQSEKQSFRNNLRELNVIHFGQLGLNDQKDRMFPNLCKSLRSQNVNFVSCGADHTAVLTKDGGVFTFGAGTCGQLGHGSKNNELLPRKVFELMGSTVSQIACGNQHTLAFVPSSGRLYSFGLGGSGQLGQKSVPSSDLPQPVDGWWMTLTSAVSVMEVDGINPLVARCIYAGGDTCFTVMSGDEESDVDDFRVFAKDKRILTIDETMIDTYARVSPAERLSNSMKENIEAIFSSAACLNGSFLLSNDGHFNCSSRNHGVDLNAVKTGFKKLSECPNRLVAALICSCLESHLLSSLPTSPPDVEALRVYLALPFMHFFADASSYKDVICRFGGAILKLDTGASSVLDKWWAKLQARDFKMLIQIYKNCILNVFNSTAQGSDYDVLAGQRYIQICLEVLKKLNNINEKSSQIVPYDSFYISALSEKVDIRMDYVSWRQQQPTSGQNGRHSFCNYPFIFDAQAKTILLHTDAAMQMQAAVDEVSRRNLTNFLFPVSLIDPVCPCLILYISRTQIVHDTIEQLTKQGQADLKKPLKVMFAGEEAIDAGGVKKVVFIGEDAVDEGGVRKEFFMLLIREILDPKYGMFVSYDESRLLWFTDLCFEDSVMFSLIGKLCGLAIYNYTIIDLPFPTALYKKLLNRPIVLDDLRELDPSLGRSLQQLLDYEEDDMEEVFCLNFEITRERFGEIEHIELIRNGTNIAVNQSNKQDYVDSYIDFVFNKSVLRQFMAFYDGFHNVCGGKVLELFHPLELQAMVVGNENYDWEELKGNTEYKGEYHPLHRTIKFFWDVFEELSLKKKKKFLFFLTGSDRIPILGMKAVKVIIQPVGGGEDFLPVAHTCFNLLDLPKYTNKQRLQEKLVKAIEQSQGFGLV